jgi:hypothetical protein
MPQYSELDRCADVLDRLDAWIDRDLDEAEAAMVEAHLAGCESCQAERRLAEEVVAELRAMPEFEVPARVLQTVRRKTRPGVWERLHSFFEGTIRQPLPTMAALAAVVLMVVVVSQWSGRQEPQYSDEEIRRATEETKLALAYVGILAQRAELRVKEEVFDRGPAARTVRRFGRTFQIIGEMGAVAATPPTTPQPTVKGS